MRSNLTLSALAVVACAIGGCVHSDPNTIYSW